MQGEGDPYASWHSRFGLMGGKLGCFSPGRGIQLRAQAQAGVVSAFHTVASEVLFGVFEARR
jgi:hypothetical protein